MFGSLRYCMVVTRAGILSLAEIAVEGFFFLGGGDPGLVPTLTLTCQDNVGDKQPKPLGKHHNSPACNNTMPHNNSMPDIL